MIVLLSKTNIRRKNYMVQFLKNNYFSTNNKIIQKEEKELNSEEAIISIHCLPNEMIAHIWSYLSDDEMYSTLYVSKTWKDITIMAAKSKHDLNIRKFAQFLIDNLKEKITCQKIEELTQITLNGLDINKLNNLDFVSQRFIPGISDILATIESKDLSFIKERSISYELFDENSYKGSFKKIFEMAIIKKRYNEIVPGEKVYYGPQPLCEFITRALEIHEVKLALDMAEKIEEPTCRDVFIRQILGYFERQNDIKHMLQITSYCSTQSLKNCCYSFIAQSLKEKNDIPQALEIVNLISTEGFREFIRKQIVK